MKQIEIARILDSNDPTGRWNDWKWQMKHAIRDIPTFENVTGAVFSAPERKSLEKTIEKFPMSITPYYLSLINPNDVKNDPVFKQCFPSPSELIIENCDMEDPLAEERDSPVEGITHRYPDRVLFLISNVCAMYCRHCTRKRKVGNVDNIPDRNRIEEGLEYIRKNTQVRDVLLSGGDPLMLPDEYIDWILTQLRNISHVEVIRIGTRVPVVLPYRITENLAAILKKHHPIWINTHFNHPKEITPQSTEALRKLVVAFLSKQGRDCAMASNGTEALSKINKSRFDAVITDIVMPEMDGITLMKELLSLYPNLPIMVMTGYSGKYPAESVLAAGARDFIGKPFNYNEFVLRFNKMMTDHRISLELESRQKGMLVDLHTQSSDKITELQREIVNLKNRLSEKE